jgi:hypothetical protein
MPREVTAASQATPQPTPTPATPPTTNTTTPPAAPPAPAANQLTGIPRIARGMSGLPLRRGDWGYQGEGP